MSKLQLLSRLSPKTVMPPIMPGGIPELTPELISGALAGLSRGPYLYALAKYGTHACTPRSASFDDVRALREIVRELTALLDIDPAIIRWRARLADDRKESATRTLARIALAERLTIHTCHGCQGTGYQVNRRCRVCGGIGTVNPDMAKRARLATIPEDTWRRSWQDKLDIAWMILGAWEEMAERKLRRGLSD